MSSEGGLDRRDVDALSDAQARYDLVLARYLQGNISLASHATLRHPPKPSRVVVPIHAGRIVNPGLLSDLLKDASLTVGEPEALL